MCPTMHGHAFHSTHECPFHISGLLHAHESSNPCDGGSTPSHDPHVLFVSLSSISLVAAEKCVTKLVRYSNNYVAPSASHSRYSWKQPIGSSFSSITSCHLVGTIFMYRIRIGISKWLAFSDVPS